MILSAYFRLSGILIKGAFKSGGVPDFQQLELRAASKRSFAQSFEIF